MRVLPAGLATALLFVSGSAWAAGWGDLEKVFPAFPCQDGWMACLVDGALVSPDLSHASTGAAEPADLRVGWDLQPTAVFSPFPKLSEYTGKLPPPEPPPAQTEVASNDDGAQTGSGSATSAPSTPTATASNSTPTPTASTPSSDAGTTSMVRPSTGSGSSDGGGSSMVRPSSTTSSGSAEAAPTSSGTPTASITPVAQQTTAPPNDSCDNRTALEPVAALGKLSAGQTSCLDTAYKEASKQTDKDKISRLLMANAWGKGDKKEWERLAKRHLDEVDQSDPDICYKYAMQLQSGGAGRANGVIKWANVALDNRTVWTGQTYQDRVAALYKLRTAAAQSLWKKAEDDLAANPGDDAQKKADDARNQTKVFAREWYEFLKAASKDTTTAMQVCVQAAGTKDYCEGS